MWWLWGDAFMARSGIKWLIKDFRTFILNYRSRLDTSTDRIGIVCKTNLERQFVEFIRMITNVSIETSLIGYFMRIYYTYVYVYWLIGFIKKSFFLQIYSFNLMTVLRPWRYLYNFIDSSFLPLSLWTLMRVLYICICIRKITKYGYEIPKLFFSF